MGIFMAPILKFVFFRSKLGINIKVLKKNFLDWASIGGDTIFQLSLRLKESSLA
jgi:hypothetical protein